MARPERIILSGRKVKLTGGDGCEMEASVSDFVGAIVYHSIVGAEKIPLPKNHLLWNVHVGPLGVVILELDPALRRLVWIDPESKQPFGAQAQYTPRKLATPYCILKVPFLKGRIIPRVELFYRNKPVRTIQDQLYWANLLNVSPNCYDCIAWVCTQYLWTERPKPGTASGLHALLQHLWGGSFNRSSEMHEGASAFSKAVADQVDPRVTDVDRWEAESIKDPRFVLGVNWKPAGTTVEQLITNEIAQHGVARDLGQTSELANLVVSCNGQGAKSRKGGA